MEDLKYHCLKFVLTDLNPVVNDKYKEDSILTGKLNSRKASYLSSPAMNTFVKIVYLANKKVEKTDYKLNDSLKFVAWVKGVTKTHTHTHTHTFLYQFFYICCGGITY